MKIKYRAVLQYMWLGEFLLHAVFLSAQTKLMEDVSHPPDTGRNILSRQRVMQTFDFEERKLHYFNLPMYWKKTAVRPGFPHYSRGKLDTQFHRSGQYSFELIPDGGSVGFEYNRRRIPARPGSDYQVIGYAHLENAHNCRVQLTAALADRMGIIIPGSLFKSQLAGPGDQGPDGWVKLRVYLPGNFPGARFITVGIWLLQQEEWNQDEPAAKRIYINNVKAKAWFDDISIYQLPRVILRSVTPSNVFSGGEKVDLEVEVEGVGILDYQAHLRVTDASSRQIWEEKWILTGVEGEKSVHGVSLGALPAGLYEAVLTITSMGKLITTRKLIFARCAALADTSHLTGQDFGVILMDDEQLSWPVTMDLINNLDIRRIKLPVWKRHPQANSAVLSERNFERNLIRLQENHIQTVAVFAEVPVKLAQKINMIRPELLDVLSMKPALWRAEVAYILAQYARQIPYWQIGGDFAGSGVWDPRIGTVLQSLRAEFATMVQDTIMAVPLNSINAVSRQQLGTDYIALQLPNAILPSQIPDYLADNRKRGLKKIWVTLNPLDRASFGWQQMLVDFIKRVAFSRVGGAEAVFIKHPWRQNHFNARSITEPTILYPVYRTLADYLGGTKYLGRFWIAEGIPALIFDRDGEGCLLTWNEKYDPYGQAAPPEIKMYLGKKPQQVDWFGNRSELPQEKGQVRLHITDRPVLISNIDSRLALLRASLQLTPRVIEAGISRQKLTLSFMNPFAMVVSGHIRFLLDERKNRNWFIDPSIISFYLQPRQKLQQEITLKLPSNELGGRKKLDLYFTIDADRNYRLQTSIPFEIQLKGIDTSIFTRRINQHDLLIQQVVTNESDKEISLNSFMDLPNQDHWERVIPHLEPGATVTKSYLVRKADQWLGQYIRLGLYDPKGTKRINYLVAIN